MAFIAVDGKDVADFRGVLPLRKGAKGYPARPLEGITMVVVHYSGVDADSSALEIAEYQTTKTTGDLFPECAYSFVVRWDGRIEQCHDLEKRTWHAGGGNNDAGIGICLPGSDRPTPKQLDSAGALIRALNRELGRQLRVVGHKELSATLCPGPSWHLWKGKLAHAAGGTWSVDMPKGGMSTPPAHPQGGNGEGEGTSTPPVSPFPAPPIPVILGFRQLYDYLGEEKCGVALAPERYDARGNSSQLFTRCEMRWDKAENRVWVSFTEF